MIKKTIWTGLLGLSLTTQALTLDEALTKALEQSPELRAARAEAQAAEVGVALSTLWQNPELDVEAEGIGGDNNGVDSAEYTVLISQEFPLFGKLRKSRAVADYAAEAARIEVSQTGLDFEAVVRQAFVDLQAGEILLNVRAQQVLLAEDFLKTAQARHEAGAASEIEVLRAEMELDENRGEQLAAEKIVGAVRNRLARLTGFPALGEIEGDFFQPLENPVGMFLAESHPALRLFQTLEKQADAELVREQAERIPNLTVSAGSRYEEDGGVQTYLFGVGIPLPLFNRGQTGSAAASFRAEAARAETETVRRALERELDALIVDFETASAEAFRIREVLLPKAERAAELSREGYASGRYGWLEWIEMQKMLEDARIQAVEAQHAAWTAHIELSKFKNGEE
ncbi:MAG: TolC family protein [Kiritimatiellaeota bacterium]|nr:TolC family protein [Kiritimatiellota bacterium]